jgi:hypothetical protein
MKTLLVATLLVPTISFGQDASIRPFRVRVPEEALTDLHRRIVATRWPDKETDQSQGTQLARLQELVRYWGNAYDWRKTEAKLNALPQFTTNIDGVDIHFIHVRSRHENALPVILTHLNLPATLPPEVSMALGGGGPAPAGLSDKERAVFDALVANAKKGNSAYFVMMTARPQTVGYGATDSPVGLARPLRNPTLGER